MASCGGGGGGDGDITVEETDGSLTINGLSNYNGKYVEAENYYLLALVKLDNKSKTMTAGKVVNGSVTLKVWKKTEEGAFNYKGNDTNVTLDVVIHDAETLSEANFDSSVVAMGGVTVDFTNGVGTGTFDNVQKTIKITDIDTTMYNNRGMTVAVAKGKVNKQKVEAWGQGKITSSSCEFPLISKATNEQWKGSGNLYVYIFIEKTSANPSQDLNDVVAFGFTQTEDGPMLMPVNIGHSLITLSFKCFASVNDDGEKN